MATLRRNGAPKPNLPSTTLSTPIPTTVPPSAPIFLLIYPFTLILGSLFSLLDPSARSAPYSSVSQSHPPDVAPSYFAQKKNIFNLYFVKVGWFWITASYFCFLFTRAYRVRRTLTSTSSGGAEVIHTPGSKERVQGLARWGLVTGWWVVVTQWFFGPALIDRGFRWTGGKCDILLEEGAKDAGELVTAVACKLAGGAWAGGTDISGHVFLLVLGSAFLAMEVVPVIMAVPESKTAREEEEGEGGGSGWATWFVAAVGGLSWWMLLMTAAYFHTWFEKLTGLLVAFAALSSVYVLPALVPELQEIVGTPVP